MKDGIDEFLGDVTADVERAQEQMRALIGDREIPPMPTLSEPVYDLFVVLPDGTSRSLI